MFLLLIVGILQMANELAMALLVALVVVAWWFARKHERFCDEEGCEPVEETETEKESYGHYTG